MTLKFNKPLEIQRPHGSYRLDGYSLKAGRRMTLYGKAAFCQLVELEADPNVTVVCERPLIVPDSKPRKVVDFWGMEAGVSTFYVLLKNGELGGATKLKRAYTEFCDWVKTQQGQVKEIAVEVFESRRIRTENWASIIEHLVSHKGQVTAPRAKQLFDQLPTTFTLKAAEAADDSIDEMLARAIVFDALAHGLLVCPTINDQPLHWATVLERL